LDYLQNYSVVTLLCDPVQPLANRSGDVIPPPMTSLPELVCTHQFMHIHVKMKKICA